MNPNTTTESVYRHAARYGLPVGLYLSLASACLIFSLRSALASLLALPVTAAFPVVIGFCIIRFARNNPDHRKVAALWVFGIYTTIFATLICALLTAFYLLLFDPGFIREYITESARLLEASPMAADYSAQTAALKRISESHAVPTPMQFVASMGWSTCFLGSMISLPFAFIASRTGRWMPQRMRDSF